MELAQISVPTELRSLRYLLFNSAIPAPFCYGCYALLRLMLRVHCKKDQCLRGLLRLLRLLRLKSALRRGKGYGSIFSNFGPWTLDFGLYLG